MNKYKYVAVDLKKKKFTGIMMAQSEDQLRSLLLADNLYLVSYTILSDKAPSNFLAGKIKAKELTAFCNQFSIMVNAGIPIVECVGLLKEQNYTAYFKKVLDRVYQDVKQGIYLSDSLKKYPAVFPDFFQSMVYVGEKSGGLDKVLISLGDYYETEEKIKKKVSGALVYPITLTVLMVAVLAVMMVFVIPNFQKSFSSLSIEMPALTQMIFDISSWVADNIGTIVLVVIGTFLVIKLIGSTQKGRLFFDEIKFKAPVFSGIVKALSASKFARGFGLLMSSGLDVVESLLIIHDVLGNKYVMKRFAEATEDVKKGVNITIAFNKQNIFPDMLMQMTSIGERTGELDSVLLRVCTYFDEQVSTAISSATGLIQPAVLGIMGGLIGVIFVAVYSPMLAVMQNF